MRAAVWYGSKDVRVEGYPTRDLARQEVRVKVKACGICGSDLHEYAAGPIMVPTSPDPLTGRMAPIVLGHEFSGEIVEVGRDVIGWKVGDRVVADPAIACWKCYACKRFNYNQCEMLGCTGLTDDGAFAEYVVVRAYQLYSLPEDVDYLAGALVEPLAVGVHAVKRGKLSQGERVLIVGAGPIGLAVLQAARIAGAHSVFVAEPTPVRNEVAKMLGATAVVDFDDPATFEFLKASTKGVGFDIVFECVGSETALRHALTLTRRGGRVVVVGVYEKDVKVDCNNFSLLEKDVVGCRAYAGDFETVIRFLQDGRMVTKPLITKVVRLDDIVKEGFEELVHHKDRHIKILVVPGES
ncbi:MAG TPA: 2,3-butanediol dehydrogenase [Clostridia bacterium]|nr:2,3-butanediol dehydrogenase [Clostridia bacterium]